MVRCDYESAQILSFSAFQWLEKENSGRDSLNSNICFNSAINWRSESSRALDTQTTVNDRGELIPSVDVSSPYFPNFADS